jgi:hypothetical protein
MKKETSELIQIIIFTVIALCNLFLSIRYSSREDVVGMVIFSIVVILSSVAAIGHFLAWREVRKR